MEPITWLILLAVLLIIEAITTGLTTVWFAGGALVAALASNFGAGLVVQLILFLGVSLVLLIFTRPLAVKYMSRNLEKTNVNSLVGKRAVVTQKIDNLAQSGQVKIGDIEWTARTSTEGTVIPEKTIVEIDSVTGVKLIVHEYGKE